MGEAEGLLGANRRQQPLLADLDLLRLVPIVEPADDRREVRQVEQGTDAERVHELTRPDPAHPRRIGATGSTSADAGHATASGSSPPGRSSAVLPSGGWVGCPWPRRQRGASASDESSV